MFVYLREGNGQVVGRERELSAYHQHLTLDNQYKHSSIHYTLYTINIRFSSYYILLYSLLTIYQCFTRDWDEFVFIVISVVGNISDEAEYPLTTVTRKFFHPLMSVPAARLISIKTTFKLSLREVNIFSSKCKVVYFATQVKVGQAFFSFGIWVK